METRLRIVTIILLLTFRAVGEGADVIGDVPRTEGLHMDQNPWAKPGRECFQGMLPLYDVTHEIGGLQVVPKSHLAERKEVRN